MLHLCVRRYNSCLWIIGMLWNPVCCKDTANLSGTFCFTLFSSQTKNFEQLSKEKLVLLNKQAVYGTKNLMWILCSPYQNCYASDCFLQQQCWSNVANDCCFHFYCALHLNFAGIHPKSMPAQNYQEILSKGVGRG